MNMQNDGDQPAFPVRHEDGSGGYAQHSGMTLRDWFAGQALAGWLAMHSDPASEGTPYNHAAKASYAYADAMLAARSKTP